MGYSNLYKLIMAEDQKPEEKLRGCVCGCTCVCERVCLLRHGRERQHVYEQTRKHVSTGKQFVYFIFQSTENQTKPKKAPAFVYKMAFKDGCDL